MNGLTKGRFVAYVLDGKQRTGQIQTQVRTARFPARLRLRRLKARS